MKVSVFNLRKWIRDKEKWSKTHSLSVSEFNAVRKRAGYLACLSALDKCLAGRGLLDKSVNLAWLHGFVEDADFHLHEREARHESDIFFGIGFRKCLEDIRVDFDGWEDIDPAWREQ